MAIAAAPQVFRAASQAAPKVLKAVQNGGDAYRKLEQWYKKTTGVPLSQVVTGSATPEQSMAAIEGAVRFAPASVRRVGNAVFDANPALTDKEWEQYVAQIRGLHEAGNMELRRQSETKIDANAIMLADHKEQQIIRAINDVNNGQMTADGLLNLARLIHDIDDQMVETLTKRNPSLASTSPVNPRGR